MRRHPRWIGSLLAAILLLLATTAPALAHDGPTQGAEWLMADWMLFSFIIIFVATLVAFVIAYRRGLMANLEDSKYYVLTIDEPDYYTPDWAKEEPDAANSTER